MNPTSESPAPEPNLDPDNRPPTVEDDADDDPAHAADEGEGWTSEGGATSSGPATDVDRDA